MIAARGNSGIQTGIASDAELEDALNDGCKIIDLDLGTGKETVLYDGARWLGERPTLTVSATLEVGRQ